MLFRILLSIYIICSFSLKAQHIFNGPGAKSTALSFILPLVKESATWKKNALYVNAIGNVEGVKDGQIIFRGNIKNNKIEGNWVSYYPNGQKLDSGNLIKGIPNGRWYVWDAAGNLIHVRNYDADLFFRIEEEIKTKHPRYNKFVITGRYIREGDTVLKYLSASHSFSNFDIQYINTIEKLIDKNHERLLAITIPFLLLAHTMERLLITLALDK